MADAMSVDINASISGARRVRACRQRRYQAGLTAGGTVPIKGRPMKIVLVETLLEMRLAGKKIREIALCLGVNKDTISVRINRLKKAYLDGSLSGWPMGKFRSGEYYDCISNLRYSNSEVQIPKWVPNDLRQEFFDIAREFGEFAAASHCRAMKANAQ